MIRALTHALYVVMPAALERLYLQWARAELTRRDPFHADLPGIVMRIRELESV